MEEKRSLGVFTREQAEMLPVIIREMMTPVMAAMSQMLENNTAALNQLAATQQVANDRLEALEKQIRLNTLVTPQQVRYFNDAIRSRARELLYKREVDDDKATRRLGNAIRKSVLSRYGVSALHEIPKHEYNVALNQIAMWNDMLLVRDAVKEARARAADGMEAAGRGTVGDVSVAVPCLHDQPSRPDSPKGLEG